MARLRAWVVVLAMLEAGPVRADCQVVPAVDFSAASAEESPAAVAAFLRGVGDSSDLAWKRPGQPVAQEAGACTVQWIAAWAKNGAWLEEISSQRAENERAENLAGAALAYLKVRSFARDDERETIEGWLIQAADLAGGKIKVGDPRRLWLGLASGAVGLATGSERHWEVARGIAEVAAKDVGADGGWPFVGSKELIVQSQVEALMPMVALATLARAQGEDFYALGGGAIDRLAGSVVKALVEQPDVKPGAGWSQLYALHAPEAAGAKIAMPRSFAGFGGDVQMLVRSLEPVEQE